MSAGVAAVLLIVGGLLLVAAAVVIVDCGRQAARDLQSERVALLAERERILKTLHRQREAL